MQFKTNAKCAGCEAAIISAVKNRFPNAEWHLHLDTADKILECHGIPEDAEKAAQIVKTIEETGFKGSWIQQ